MQTLQSFEALEKLIALCRDRDFPVFEKGDYNLNTIGVRNPNRKAGTFDDVLHVFFKENGVWRLHSFQSTTDPGLAWLRNNEQPEGLGTGIIKGNEFYSKSHKLGWHRGYKALVQHGNLKIYRDGNRDNVIDFVTEMVGLPYRGFNIHASYNGAGKCSINNFESAGCQVLAAGAKHPEWLFFYSIFEKAARTWGDIFSYGLIDE